jgi:hypothetical protein
MIFESEPEGSEIYLNGEKMNYRTNHQTERALPRRGEREAVSDTQARLGELLWKYFVAGHERWTSSAVMPMLSDTGVRNVRDQLDWRPTGDYICGKDI